MWLQGQAALGACSGTEWHLHPCPQSSSASDSCSPTVSHGGKGAAPLAWGSGPRSSPRVGTSLPPTCQPERGSCRCAGPPPPTSSASGSTGALQDITLSHQPSSTWKEAWLPTSMPTAPEPTGSDPSPFLTAVEGPVEEHTAVPAEAEPDLTAQGKGTTHPPRGTTQQPTTHRASTPRATTAPAPTTSRPHRDTQPDHPETSAPAAPEQLQPHVLDVEDGGPAATERAAVDGDPSQFPAGEGSGEQVGARSGVLSSRGAREGLEPRLGVR